MGPCLVRACPCRSQIVSRMKALMNTWPPSWLDPPTPARPTINMQAHSRPHPDCALTRACLGKHMRGPSPLRPDGPNLSTRGSRQAALATNRLRGRPPATAACDEGRQRGHKGGSQFSPVVALHGGGGEAIPLGRRTNAAPGGGPHNLPHAGQGGGERDAEPRHPRRVAWGEPVARAPIRTTGADGGLS